MLETPAAIGGLEPEGLASGRAAQVGPTSASGVERRRRGETVGIAGPADGCLAARKSSARPLRAACEGARRLRRRRRRRHPHPRRVGRAA